MRFYLAILFSGVLIAIWSGVGIVWTSRYQIVEPFEPLLFKRYDRLTGRVELCSLIIDKQTYCGADLGRRIDVARPI